MSCILADNLCEKRTFLDFEPDLDPWPCPTKTFEPRPLRRSLSVTSCEKEVRLARETAEKCAYLDRHGLDESEPSKQEYAAIESDVETDARSDDGSLSTFSSSQEEATGRAVEVETDDQSDKWSACNCTSDEGETTDTADFDSGAASTSAAGFNSRDQFQPFFPAGPLVGLVPAMPGRIVHPSHWHLNASQSAEMFVGTVIRAPVGPRQRDFVFIYCEATWKLYQRHVLVRQHLMHGLQHGDNVPFSIEVVEGKPRACQVWNLHGHMHPKPAAPAAPESERRQKMISKVLSNPRFKKVDEWQRFAEECSLLGVVANTMPPPSQANGASGGMSKGDFQKAYSAWRAVMEYGEVPWYPVQAWYHIKGLVLQVS